MRKASVGVRQGSFGVGTAVLSRDGTGGKLLKGRGEDLGSVVRGGHGESSACSRGGANEPPSRPVPPRREAEAESERITAPRAGRGNEAMRQ